MSRRLSRGEPRNRLGSSAVSRRAGRAQVRNHVIVVTYDGIKTEADYFRGWRRVLGTRATLKPYYVQSGGNAYHAVQASVQKAREDREFDEFWCVCDVDDTSANDLSRARALAQRHGIKLALSSRSFEVWLALHWGPISLGHLATERDAVALVSRCYPAYSQANKLLPFSEVYPRTDKALTSAAWLEAQGSLNPATSMHELVSTLQKLES